MVSLGLAIVVASLLGSLHCVGMCGPLAIWATDTTARSRSLVAYHLGRLTTYLSAGLIAGVLGSAIQIGGDFAGFQFFAAKIAGGALIAVGLIRLFRFVPWLAKTPRPGEPVVRPSRVAAWLQHAKPVLASQGPISRGYLAGLLTTWLPCGWLYLFVLVAAGTGDALAALVVMAAFWVGTLPALTGVVLGAGSLLRRSPKVMPLAAGVLLIVTGMYTATGRAAADLTRILPPEPGRSIDIASLQSVTDQPLPCCDP